jgi:alpha-ketoglutaric semialdehyde dehydrogenase
LLPTGEMLIGDRVLRGAGPKIQGIDAATGQKLEPEYGTATREDLQAACQLAAEAFRPYRATTLEQRAVFLETIAAEIEALGDDLITRAMAETGLPRPRLEGERGRTMGQLRLFAGVVRDGGFLDVRIDKEIPDRKPARRPDIRSRQIALGPVAVFGASNFPLAFSVAGGDTASALAAGCPVVVKAHNAHPGTSELAGRAIRRAVEKCGLPAGTFSLLFDGGVEIGAALVAAPEIKAVGFTGSRRGGLALWKIAQSRPEPIPLYAEMSSINPVIVLPAALKARGAAIANEFVGSLTLGSGQFCTNPGLVLILDGAGADDFVAAAGQALAQHQASPMLTPGIQKAYAAGVERLSSHADVTLVARGKAEGARCPSALFSTSADAFAGDEALAEEVFGASSLVVRCKDNAELIRVLEHLEGQLTAAVHMDGSDEAQFSNLLPVLEEKAGRILINGFGTGVEVCHAMVHGGPFPATSDGRTTSVGSMAIRRFLRPVAYQDLPGATLPDSLKDANPLAVPQMVDGKLKVP